MPRKPTGNPTGRPKGQGPLGQDIQRLTIRLPAELYQRLEAFAEGRTYTRGTPQLAGCARDLLEHALACPYKRQKDNIPLPLGRDDKRQPESNTQVHEDILQQPINIPIILLEEPIKDNRQSESNTEISEEEKRQPESDPLPYDQSKYVLGKLCPRGHEHGTTGKSLLRRTNRHCGACDREKFHERKQAKHQARSAGSVT